MQHHSEENYPFHSFEDAGLGLGMPGFTSDADIVDAIQEWWTMPTSPHINPIISRYLGISNSSVREPELPFTAVPEENQLPIAPASPSSATATKGILLPSHSSSRQTKTQCRPLPSWEEVFSKSQPSSWQLAADTNHILTPQPSSNTHVTLSGRKKCNRQTNIPLGLVATDHPPQLSSNLLENLMSGHTVAHYESISPPLHKFSTHFPNEPQLREIAVKISQEPWLITNQPEPPFELLSSRGSVSRFDVFLKYRKDESSYRCLWEDNKGTICTFVATRLCRARGHAHDHFGYRPFSCGGACGSLQCGDRYSCQAALNNHVARKSKPKRQCPDCFKEINTQNLARHQKSYCTVRRQRLRNAAEGQEPVGRVSTQSTFLPNPLSP